MSILKAQRVLDEIRWHGT
ncbi:hypothetical protein ZWY2020_025692 [Hordeum vulgare]|nr:hypothetical protein ZWY2020_025692 [Hordeum vulgare]